ncbi:MAG: hypothetical protein QXZ63_07550 [Sulfolobales archaeon]
MKLMAKLTIEDDIKYLCDEMVINIEEILNEFVKNPSLKDQITYCVKDIIKYNCDEIVRYVFNVLNDIEEGKL